MVLELLKAPKISRLVGASELLGSDFLGFDTPAGVKSWRVQSPKVGSPWLSWPSNPAEHTPHTSSSLNYNLDDLLLYLWLIFGIFLCKFADAVHFACLAFFFTTGNNSILSFVDGKFKNMYKITELYFSHRNLSSCKHLRKITFCCYQMVVEKE